MGRGKFDGVENAWMARHDELVRKGYARWAAYAEIAKVYGTSANIVAYHLDPVFASNIREAHNEWRLRSLYYGPRDTISEDVVRFRRAEDRRKYRRYRHDSDWVNSKRQYLRDYNNFVNHIDEWVADTLYGVGGRLTIDQLVACVAEDIGVHMKASTIERLLDLRIASARPPPIRRTRNGYELSRPQRNC